MSKKVFLSPSNQYDNHYAYGNTTEAVQCGKIAKACKAALIRNGIDVMLMHDESMQEKCQKSNAFGADLHVPIHTNAFNSSVSGTRMFYYVDGGEGHKACKAIFARLAPVTPGNSESIRADASLYEVRVPSAPTAYCECEFHDNANTAKWIVENTTLIGETIAHGICDYFGISFNDGKAPEVVPTPAPSKKSVDELAREVIRGEWGNGSNRRVRLERAGYDYDAVQNRVNEILEGAPSTPKKSIDELAREVIRGDWGNGSARRKALENAGYDYDAVQDRVNEILE
mgnify:FL=1|jgi:hypothetical protein|nr:MAG TPA: peptidoglycan hydrolase [Caudoviricetes sp.]